MPRKLAVVPAGASSERKPGPVTIKQAAEASERALLVAMRSHLCAELDKGAVPAHALAGVMAKVREYDRDIRAIDERAQQEGDERGPTEDEAWSAV